nr:hypothetical protein GCM10020092_042460 [Actinoplanes digitatis]
MLFSDDFSDGDAAGWRTSGGAWSVAEQSLRQADTGARAVARAGEASWSDYAVSVRVRPAAYRDAGSSAGVQARVQGDGSHYYLTTRADNTVELGRVSGGRSTTLATAAYPAATQIWRYLTLVVKGTTLLGVVNGEPLLRATDTRLARGRAGLATTYTDATFDDVSVGSYAATTPDTQAPLTPGRPRVVEVTPTTVTLSWLATIDNVGVVDYVVYQGEQFYQQYPVRTVTGTGPITLTISPTAATIHYAVAARDAAEQPLADLTADQHPAAAQLSQVRRRRGTALETRQPGADRADRGRPGDPELDTRDRQRRRGRVPRAPDRQHRRGPGARQGQRADRDGHREQRRRPDGPGHRVRRGVERQLQLDGAVRAGADSDADRLGAAEQAGAVLGVQDVGGGVGHPVGEDR